MSDRDRYDDPEDYSHPEYDEFDSNALEALDEQGRLFEDKDGVGGDLADFGSLADRAHDFEQHEAEVLRIVDLDEHLAFVVQARKLGLSLRTRLPGVTTPDYLREKIGIEYDPLGEHRTPLYIRNLFTEAAHLKAQEQANSTDPDIAWAAGQWLHHRSQALGKYCYNTNCPKFPCRLPDEAPRRGRPRLYHCESCKVAGTKRHQRNAADPLRWERLRNIVLPSWVPSVCRYRPSLPSSREIDRDSGWTSKHEAALRKRGVPQRDELGLKPATAELVAPTLTADYAMNRWVGRHLKKKRSYTASRDWGDANKAERSRTKTQIEKALGVSLEELVFRQLNDGYVFEGEERAAIEELLGRTLDSLVAGEDPDSERETTANE